MKRNNLHLIIIILLGTVLRLFQLGARPFDGDEGVVLKIAYNSWPDLIKQAGFDVHPPLFHLLLKPWLDIFGIYEWSARLPSAILALALVYLIFIFIKKLFNNQKLALTAAFLATISSYLLYPSQETRMYLLFALLTLASYYFFWHLIKYLFDESPVAKKYWFGYIIFSTLMLYSQYLGLVVLFSQLSYLVFIRIKDKTAEICKKNIGKWLVAWVSIAMLFLPQWKTLISQFIARISEQSQELSLWENIKGLFGAGYRFGSGRLFLDLDPANIIAMTRDNPWLFIGFLISLIIPLLFLFQGLRIVYQKYYQQFWFLLVPILMAMLLTIFSTEVGSRANRYLIYIFPFYLIFLSFAWLDWWQQKTAKILVIVFLLINLIGIYQHYQVENKAPGVNKISAYIYQNYQVGDAVLIRGGFGGGEEWVFRYYWNRLQATGYRPQVYDLLGNYRIGNLAELKAVKPQDKISQLLQTYQRVWFYDLTYQEYKIAGQAHYLGQDKEKKDLVVWEIEKH